MDQDSYQYDRLDDNLDQFRVLQLHKGHGRDIETTLVTTTLGDGTLPYEAVSYTWGKELEADTLTISGKSLPITLNLSLILRDLRSSETDRILWIDAVCIDQKRNVERGHQVQKMQRIYRHAVRVLFCVSRPSEPASFLFSILGKFQEQLEREDQVEAFNVGTSQYDNVWALMRTEMDKKHFCLQARLQKGLEHVLQQPWFRRVWIIQEVDNSRDAWIYCGNDHISALIFADSLRLIDLPVNAYADSRYSAARKILALMSSPSQRSSDCIQSRDLRSLLHRFRYTEATEGRDKIFALFGLCTDAQLNATIPVDYDKPLGEVLRDTTTYILQCNLDKVKSMPYDTLETFYENYDRIEDVMLPLLLSSDDAPSAAALMKHGGARVTVTQELLKMAARIRDKQIMELILQRPDGSAALKAAVERGWSPLFWAVKNWDAPFIKLLIQEGASWTVTDENGSSPLLVAARCGNEAAVKLLLDLRPLSCLGSERFALSAATVAAMEYGHLSVAKLLLQRLRDNPGFSMEVYHSDASIVAAVENGPEALRRMLVDHTEAARHDSEVRLKSKQSRRIPQAGPFRLQWIPGSRLD